MGQRKWACVCALVAALGCAGRLTAQEQPVDAQSNAAVTESPGLRPMPGDAEARIKKVLDQPLRDRLDFVETPLHQVMSILAEAYDIPIIFDTAALEAVAISPDAECHIAIDNVSVRSALELILKSVGTEDLTYIIDKEVLLITTQEVAEQRLEVRVYRVDDLVTPDASRAELERLIEIIIASVESESWAENGTGQGELNSFDPAMLIVSNTHHVHEQLDALLGDLRRTKSAIENDHAAESDAATKRPATRAIRLRDATTATPESRKIMEQTLQRSVDWQPENDDIDEGELYLHVLQDLELVRHLPAVIRQVESVIHEIAPQKPGAYGGGGGGGFGGGTGSGGGGRGGGF